MRNKPRIRFKGFTEDWEQRKLDDVFQIIDGDRGKNYPGTGDFLSNGDVLFLDTGNVRKDGFNFDNKRYIDFSRDKLLRNGRLILGDYVLTSRGTLGNLAYYSQSIYNRYPQIRINSAMLILRVMNTIKVNNLYLYITLRSNVINEFMKHNFVGSAQPHITKKEFSSVLLPIPRQLEEQKIIGDFFDKLEKIITLHQRKLEKLKLAKKALLQKLFPKNGSQFPEIRFKGFTDAWEHRKFDEIMTFINGRAYKQDELLSDGKYKVLRVGNFYTNDSWYYSNLELDDKYYAMNGDLLYTWSATFGPHIWKGEKVIYHYHIWKIVLKNKIDKLFALQLLEVDKANIMSDKNGSTMVHITKQGMENKKTILPLSLNEQKQISKFLSSIDKLITLHQRKLERLQEVKKGLLQKMFV